MAALAGIALPIPGVAGADGAGGPVCPVEGEPIQWVADYCMLKLQTDDEIAASACIEEEGGRRFADACASNQYFKAAMCEMLVQAGTRRGTVEACVRDPSFRGRTVAADGVGG